jgi:hypothetical protein
MQWDAGTAALLRRCGLPLGNNLERHHRQRREVGGDRLANLLALHSDCHRWITEHPAGAMEQGWIVSTAAADPALVPVRLPGLSGSAMWLLDDDGGRVPVP